MTKQDMLNYGRKIKEEKPNLFGLYLHTLLKINFKEVDFFNDLPWVRPDNSRVAFYGRNKNGESFCVVSHNIDNVWD